MFEFDLVFFQYFVDALEKISIHNRLAFFEEEVGTLSNKSVLVVNQTVLKCSEITLPYSLHEWLKFIESILVQNYRLERN